MKHKRVWTDEQRQAAAERIRRVTANRIAKRGEQAPKVRAPEVQAVLDTMTPERKARLAMIQARQLQTREGQAALARHEYEKQIALQTETVSTNPIAVLEPQTIGAPGMVLPPSRIGSREVSIIERTDGTVVSQYGPCICGEAKRVWHKNCSR